MCKSVRVCVNVPGRTDYPTDGEELDKQIKYSDELDHQTGLTISRVKDEIIKDEYYALYKDFFWRRNLSQNNFSVVPAGILEARG